MSATPAPRVALATAPEFWPLDEDAPVLVEALRAQGLDAGPAFWDSPDVAWDEFDLVVVRSVWDYPLRRDEFLAWCDSVARSTTLLNPADVLRWNTDKHYLADLADAGIAVVPSLFIDHDDGDRTERVRDAVHSFDEVVVKPTVSAGSKGAGRWRSARSDEAIRHGLELLGDGRDIVVQPYIDPSGGHEEVDVICFDGVPSHAIHKGPMLSTEGSVSNDPFAVETIAVAELTGPRVDLATAVLDAVATRFQLGSLLYGRVDLLSTDDAPLLLEVELTEPSLFLTTDDHAAARVAAAIADRLNRAGRV